MKLERRKKMQKREWMKGNKNWETKGRKGKESVEGDHRPPLLFIYCQDLFDFSVTPPPPPTQTPRYFCFPLQTQMASFLPPLTLT